MKISNPTKLVICIIVAQLAGIIGGFFTTSAITSWYSLLNKPSFNPPAWLFGPVWTTLFVLMGVAAFLVWKEGLQKKTVKIALGIFLVQLVLNTFWSIIFFGWHNPGAAFIEIIFLWLAILINIIVFAKISKVAAWLLVPYILWVSFAAFLNFTLWQINPVEIKSSKGVLCTMEAKICPDGSTVGRIGPNCEFAPCLEKSLDKSNLIKLETPVSGASISSPLVVKGQARGTWFFEGSFPVVLVDWDGKIIGTGIAQAQGEWMTTEFVPFLATLKFTKPDVSVSNRGALILRKDNPSGLPQNDDALEITVVLE